MIYRVCGAGFLGTGRWTDANSGADGEECQHEWTSWQWQRIVEISKHV